MNSNHNYGQQLTVKHPGDFFLTIDQSFSMRDPYSEDKNKAEFTASAINQLIRALIIMLQFGEVIKDKLRVVLIGYGGQGGDSVQVIRDGMISEYANHPLRTTKVKQKVVDGDLLPGEILVDQPEFIDPQAKGSTSMGVALQTAHGLIKDFSRSIIMNISDGSPWSNKLKFGEIDLAREEAKSLMSKGTLIYNAHIGNGQPKLICPNQVDRYQGRQANFLFDISSEIPVWQRNAAQKHGFCLQEKARGFVSNASPDMLVKFINFGSTGFIAGDRI